MPESNQQHEALLEMARRMSDQVDELAEQRIERNARIKGLEAALREIEKEAYLRRERHIAAIASRALEASNPAKEPEETL